MTKEQKDLSRIGETDVEPISSRTAATAVADSRHIALPFRRLEYRDSDRMSLSIVNANNERVASVSDWIEDGDYISDRWADFIIRACNSHYDLLHALKALTAPTETVYVETITPEESRRRLDMARAAITKAEGR